MHPGRDIYQLSGSSEWASIKTAYHFLLGYCALKAPKRILQVGAADGRLIEPFLALFPNSQVVAVEKSVLSSAISDLQNIYGKTRLEIINEDFLNIDDDIISGFDVVFTSCAWHYKSNSDRIQEFIRKMQGAIEVGGVFFAEFMYLDPAREDKKGYFPDRKGLFNLYFDSKSFSEIAEFYSNEYLERGHTGNTSPHSHQLGFILCQKVL